MPLEDIASGIEQQKALARQMGKVYDSGSIKFLSNVQAYAIMYIENPSGRKDYINGMQRNLSDVYKIYAGIPFDELKAEVYKPLFRIRDELLPEVESVIRRLVALNNGGEDAMGFLYRILNDCIKQIQGAGIEYGNNIKRLVDEINQQPGGEGFRIDAKMGKVMRSDIFKANP